MTKEMVLNKRLIKLIDLENRQIDGMAEIAVEFEVTSEDYHEIATLLYEPIFDVEVPELRLAFKGEIIQYSTSFTNLYEANQVAVYSLTLREVLVVACLDNYSLS